jgi:hypothetical protein
MPRCAVPSARSVRLISGKQGRGASKQQKFSMASVAPTSSLAEAKNEDALRVHSHATHGLRSFSIRWQYASRLELPRTTIVQAATNKAAQQQVLRNHLDPTSTIRNAIEWLP